MKYEFEASEKPNKYWTVERLRQYVSWEVKIVNARLAEYRAQVDIGEREESKLVESEIKRLQDILSKGRGKDKFIGVGYEKSTKTELLFKAKTLYQFTQWDIYTPASVRELEEKYEKAYTNFSELYAEYGYSLSREDYTDLVTIFGIIDDKILNQFGSDTVANIYSRASSTQKHNLLQYMLKINKQSKGKGWTVETLSDMLAEMMKVDKEEQE